jgi:hypothetical protein
MRRGRTLFTKMTFKDKGRTDGVMWLWSGDTLMDLSRYQALKMALKTVDGGEYLFIESGGFSARHPAGWQTPWYVMKRQAR